MSKWTPEQQRAISESGTNIIVSAGAGSGKTAVLSERVIEKLENNIHVNELLILTFTNAAAAEMKDRIRKKISKNPKFRDELDLLSSSYITTFDSFALSVLKKYHYLLNVSNNISITDESIVLIEEEKILNQIFEELYESRKPEFINLINKTSVKNDNRIRENILKVALKINSDIRKDEYIKYIRDEYFSDENIKRIINDFDNFIKEKKSVIKLELENLKYYFDSDYVSLIESSISSLMECSTTDLHLYTSVNLPNAPRGSSEEAKEAKKTLKTKLDKLISYGEYGSFNDIKSSILNSKEDINVILDIVVEFIKRLDEYKRRNNIYTFNDVASLSIKILKENESVREELKSSFKEIMIDEYQDTNDVQDIFINLISNNNVYMVGDIKQSIYKFRGSNPNIFKEKYDLYSSNNGGIKIDLIKNFRSRSEVLNNINKIFELLMDSEIGGASYKISHEMVYGNTAYDTEKEKDFKYDVDIFEYENTSKDFTNNEIEMFKIVNDIKSKMSSHMKVFDKETNSLRDITYNDFVIILDRSKYFTDYKKVFEYFGVPLTILKDEELNSNQDIMLLKNLIDFVIRINNEDYNVEFKYDFISIARSFLYEYSDEEIFNCFKNNSFRETSIYKDLSTINNINSMTSSIVLERILDVTNFYNKIYKVGEYEDINVRLNTLYNIALNINELGYDINDFSNYLDDLIKNGIDIKYNGYKSSSDSVKIMTIHKSKGLEFPICYFADLDHEFNIRDLTDEFIVSSNYGLIIPNEDENSVIKELYKYNYIKEEIGERLRLLYVALTRAREKMIILVPYKDTKKMELDEDGVIDRIRRLDILKLSDFIYYIKDYLKDYFVDVDLNTLNLTKNYLFKKDIKNSLNNKTNDFIVSEISIQNESIDNNHFSKEVKGIISNSEYKQMKYGTLVHEILEYTDFKNYDPSLIEDKFIRDKVTNLINSELFKNIENAKIYKEYEFNYIKDNINYNGIIDLMLEYNDHIDIIDYKLKNVSDEKYLDQLNGYKNYISIKSNKNINIYLYSVMDGIIKEI